jgi:hypothetical protein
MKNARKICVHLSEGILSVSGCVSPINGASFCTVTVGKIEVDQALMEVWHHISALRSYEDAVFKCVVAEGWNAVLVCMWILETRKLSDKILVTMNMPMAFEERAQHDLMAHHQCLHVIDAKKLSVVLHESVYSHVLLPLVLRGVDHMSHATRWEMICATWQEKYEFYNADTEEQPLCYKLVQRFIDDKSLCSLVFQRYWLDSLCILVGCAIIGIIFLMKSTLFI